MTITPRYIRIIPDIREDILWRVGPSLQHGASITTVRICCNLDLPQMTQRCGDNALMRSWMLACDWIIASDCQRLSLEFNQIELGRY